ncbi:MAG: C-terminal binding protein [Cohnella sp.]|nr:C-terminal binding protein [Cohnella sp.]
MMKNGKKLVWILDDEWTDHLLEEKIYHEHGFEVKVTRMDALAEDLPDYAPYADGVVAQVGFPCGADLIEQLHMCKAIAISGVGFNHVDIKAATQKGIVVANVPDYCMEEVSDHTVALMLAVSRRLIAYRQAVLKGNWDPMDTKSIYRFKDRNVGLLGFGRIARKVAEKLQGFGVRIQAHDEYVSADTFQQYGVTAVSLEDLLRKSDILSLHVPLTPETSEMLNYERMKSMPKGAVIINTCRGGVIRETDLQALIIEGHLAGAGLDVLAVEPPGPDHPLKSMEEVLITPHSSYISVESVKELKERTCLIVIDAVNGHKLSYSLNPQVS